MAYTAEHRSALRDVRKNGNAITFTLEVSGAYNAATGITAAPTRTTVVGHALRVRGRSKRYEELKLRETDAPTLLFVPTTYGEEPPLGASGTFGGVAYKVADVDPVAPDGTVIMARVIVVR